MNKIFPQRIITLLKPSQDLPHTRTNSIKIKKCMEQQWNG